MEPRPSARALALEAFGWYGAVAIVLAYALVSFGIVTAQSLPYQLLNASGAIGIVAVSLWKRAYQPAALNAVWTVIAVVALVRLAVS